MFSSPSAVNRTRSAAAFSTFVAACIAYSAWWADHRNEDGHPVEQNRHSGGLRGCCRAHLRNAICRRRSSGGNGLGRMTA
jgi:hypothetical protein